MSLPKNLDLKQTSILAKIKTYLEKRNEFDRQKLQRELKDAGKDDGFIANIIDSHKKEDDDFIKKYFEKGLGKDFGYCAGISSLWVYARWRQTRPKTYYLPIVAPKIDPDDIFVDSDWDMLAKSVIDSSWYEIRENLDELEKLLELSDEDVVVGLTSLEGKEGFKRVVKNKEQLRKFILLGRSKKPDKVAIESEDWLSAVKGVIDDSSDWGEIEERSDELKGLLKLSDIEVSTKLSELERLDNFKNVVKNKEQLRSFILLGRYIKDNRSQDQISLSALKRVPRDDYDWFRAVVDRIAGWDEDFGSLSDEDKDDVERFIQHIHFFQHLGGECIPTATQGELAAVLPSDEVDETDRKKVRRVLEDTSDRDIRQEYSIASLFDLRNLKKLLRTRNVIQERKLVLIRSHKHATALFRDGDTYYYLDPNSETGEFVSGSLNSVAKHIFEANFGYGVDLPMPLGFKMFSFDERLASEYPNQQRVLSEIDPDLDRLGARFGYGVNGLMMAAIIGCLESVRYFLGKGVDVNIQSTTGDGKKNFTALMIAAERGHFDIVREILNKGRDVKLNIRNANGDTAVMVAAELGYSDIVREILNSGKYTNLNIQNTNGNTALMLAVKFGHLDVVREILNSDKNVALNLRNNGGETALTIALKNGNIDIVKEILNSGRYVNCNLQYTNGWTALMLAAKYGKLEVVREILSRGEDVNVNLQDADGCNVIILAIIADNVSIAQEILKRDDVDLKIQENEDDYTALMMAIDYDHISLAEEILKKEDVGLNARDKDGMTALMIAIIRGHVDLAKEILKRSDVDLAAKDNKTGSDALMFAAGKGDLIIIEEILDKGTGVDCNRCNKYGWTALMYAARFGHIDVVKKLLEAGADSSIRFTSGGKLSGLSNATVLEIAEKHGHGEIAAFLQGVAKVRAPESEQVEEDSGVSLKM